MKVFVFILILILVASVNLSAQFTANYDESKVGEVKLPELLTSDNGRRITTAKEWESVQRPVVLKKFADHVYGRMPGKPPGMRFVVLESDPNALNGKATRKQIRILFGKDANSPSTTVLAYLPNNVKGKVPVFIGLNFQGNHSCTTDPAVIITDAYKAVNPKDTELKRGTQTDRWSIEEVISRGYGLATAYYEDLEADHPEGYKTGIRTTLSNALKIKSDEWAALAVWGWCLSRITDYLETDPKVDARQIIVTGHSRLGKAALWSAANDLRYAMVVSNNSGEGGAALARRNFGETVERINTSFPHWFVARFKDYNKAVNNLPVDQHMLIALMAPRPVYVASATEDPWADPRGEFLGAKYAEPVYALYSKKGLGVADQPAPDSPVGETIGYHLRTGAHDFTPYDWKQYMNFADKNLRGKK